MATGLLFFTVRRSINAVITLFLLIAIIFGIVHSIFQTPTQLARLYNNNPHITDAQLQQIIQQNHLNAPIYSQAFNYIQNIFQGNLGVDLSNHLQVSYLLSKYLPITLELVVIGQIIGVVIGLFTGAIGAANRNRLPDYGVKGVYLTTWASPSFLVALILQLILAYIYNLLPSTFIVSSVNSAGQIIPAPPSVTGFPLIDGLLAGNWAYTFSVVQHLVLPALTIAIIGFGVVTRLSRASMLDSMDKDYVKLAYMKGLSKRQVTSGTVFRNAVIPIITLLALLFAFSVGGAVIVEFIFSYYGMGYYTYVSAVSFDYPAILAITIIFGIFVIVANFTADVLYAVVDPRVRLE